MGFEDPENLAYEQEQNMAMIHFFFFFFPFQLSILRSLFKPFVRWEKSNKGEAMARSCAPSRGDCRVPGSLW